MQTLVVTYASIKTVLGTVPSYYVSQGSGGYDIFACGDQFFIRTKIRSVSDVSDFETNYKSSCSSVASADDAFLLGLKANKVPLVEPRTADGRIRTLSEKSTATRRNFFTFDFTDKTTWYASSVRVVDEQPTTADNNKVFQLANPFVIDTYHGKITQEDSLKDSLGNSYRVVVSSGATTYVEKDPHNQVGQFVVNYETGSIEFDSPLSNQEATDLRVTYHHTGAEKASQFVVKPDTNLLNPASKNKLILNMAEVQFSTDIDPKDTILFEVWGIADFWYPPAAIGTNPSQIPSGTQVKLDQFVYKAISDIQNDAFRTYTSYPAMGNPANWRSQVQPISVFDWDYLSSTVLYESKGMEIRVRLEHDEPFGGWMATVTFYCMQEAE